MSISAGRSVDIGCTADADVAEEGGDKDSGGMLRHVVEGLGSPQKWLPPKFFYDSAGSRYFDQICELDEYYLYRTETTMLPNIAGDVSRILQGELDVVEFGAGSLVKIRYLLTHMPQIRRFIPIDIAGDHLRTACQALREEFQHLKVQPIEQDFTDAVELPKTGGANRLGFFPGSTIGNFSPEQAVDFLVRCRRSLGPGALLLIGVDTKKSPEILHLAYNDKSGVTEKFNRNILTHINRTIGADFVEENFDHYAFYHPRKGRVEMHLISRQEQVVAVDGQQFQFARGETIHTENSYKYTPKEFLTLASGAGWLCEQTWLAEKDLFGVYLLRAESQ